MVKKNDCDKVFNGFNVEIFNNCLNCISLINSYFSKLEDIDLIYVFINCFFLLIVRGYNFNKDFLFYVFYFRIINVCNIKNNSFNCIRLCVFDI